MPTNSCLTGGLQEYVPSPSKPWNERRVHHLYNKLCNGAPLALIKAAQNSSPSVIIDYLLDNASRFDRTPLPGDKRVGYYDFTYKWAEYNGYDQNGSDTYYKYFELVQMWFDGMIKEGIRHKLVLFWSNHFVTSADNYGYYPTWAFQYYKLLHEYALGNFKDFTYWIGINPAMLHYLDGRISYKWAPNENYARELMELFTMGDGHYTENDIAEVARALTGFQLYRYENNTVYIEPNIYKTVKFVPDYHDFGGKTILGKRFTPSTKTDWAPDYNFVINTIFEQQPMAIAKRICTKLYKFYVYQYPPDEIIDGLAQIFIQNKWQIMPVLKALFKSEHFFDDEAMGVGIKSHIDNLIHFYRSTDMKLNEDYYTFDYLRNTSPLNANKIDALGGIYNQTANLGQTLFNPVNVAGWPGYRSWLNEFSLVNRWRFNRDHFDYYLQYPQTKEKYREFLKTLTDDSTDPDYIVRKIISYFITVPIQEDIIQIAVGSFKSLVPENYFTNKTWNLDYSLVPNQFINVMKYITTLPEYQLL